MKTMSKLFFGQMLCIHVEGGRSTLFSLFERESSFFQSLVQSDVFMEDIYGRVLLNYLKLIIYI